MVETALARPIDLSEFGGRVAHRGAGDHDRHRGRAFFRGAKKAKQSRSTVTPWRSAGSTPPDTRGSDWRAKSRRGYSGAAPRPVEARIMPDS